MENAQLTRQRQMHTREAVRYVSERHLAMGPASNQGWVIERKSLGQGVNNNKKLSRVLFVGAFMSVDINFCRFGMR